jgi:hypothetical protein
MDILLKESQTKILITEGISEILSEIHESTKDYGADLYKRVKDRLGFNLKILLTFSASIGGLARPLEQFLAGDYSELNEEEILLLTVSIVSVLLFQNKDLIKELVGKVKEMGLDQEFRAGLEKGRQLKDSFNKFLANTIRGGAFLSDVIAYTYMIPLLGHLYMVLNGQDFSPEQIDMLVRRLSAIGIFHVSTAMLEMIAKKIIGKN